MISVISEIYDLRLQIISTANPTVNSTSFDRHNPGASTVFCQGHIKRKNINGYKYLLISKLVLVITIMETKKKFNDDKIKLK